MTPIAANFGFERGLPVDRYYIERFLERQSAAIRGRVLEVGDDSYTRQFGGDRVTQCEILHISPASSTSTIVADLANAPQIPDESFDCIICTQTLQLIFDVQAAIRTLHRILRAGGVLLATFPGISQIDDDHFQSSWFWNFTPASAHRLFGDEFGRDQIEVLAHGNVFTAICFLHGLSAVELQPQELDHDDPAFPFLITTSARRRSS